MDSGRHQLYLSLARLVVQLGLLLIAEETAGIITIDMYN